MDLREGDAFWITGPGNRWRGPHQGGWQPRAWSSHPDDPASERVTQDVVQVDFRRRFVALEVYHSGRFVSARVHVRDGAPCVWINVAKDGVDWVRQRRMA